MVMGVSGSGKSTVGASLADAIGGVFLDGDDYHPQANVDHMAAGKPLTDAMRAPWLAALAAAVTESRALAPTVFACSALRQTYRDDLRARIPDLKIIYLDVAPDTAAARLAKRKGHYMPASLLDSQFATFEAPKNATVSIDGTRSVDDIVTTLKALL